MKRASAIVPIVVASLLGWGAVGAQAAPQAGHVLVAFDSAVGDVARAAVHEAAGGRLVNRIEGLGIDVVEVADPALALARYRALGVARVSPNKRVRALAAPNDTLFAEQWGFHNTGQTAAGSLVRGTNDFDIDAPEGWGVAFGAGFENAGGTRVAILDTGVDRSHADLLGKVVACASATSAIGVVVEGSCSDDNLHGTHVAGTVAANTNNGLGVAGTAPNAQLAIFKFLNAGGVGFLADELAGIDWAMRNGAKVISMSFSSTRADGSEQQAMRDALNAGVLPVAAAGNEGDATKNYPAYYPEVLSVASTSANDDVSPFSVCNTDVEIGAPGEDIWSTFPGNSYGLISGTSMATPHVSGVAALVMSERGLTAGQARNVLVNTSTDVTGNDARAACSNVRQVNLAAALGGGGTEPPPPPAPGAIAGRVTEQKTKAAIASAAVSCGAAGSATTAGDGSYSITGVAPGTYSCTASKSGYASKTSNVAVNSGQTTTADFALRKL